MALLDKVSIRGIRSFGPDTDQRVKFSTPLTLILGQNGCGKTTILESLKYALTSDLPAGTENGRGFINDPKLSNHAGTKASIKLKFKDSSNNFITVAKFLEVTTKAGGKIIFKSTNPAIRWEDADGNMRDIGNRCVDIDMYCCQKLNVSKAIINNVIFCHQENSAWPLDEPKKLKEKFDDIFGSTEYNKCVEKLRKLIKIKSDDIKLLKEQVQQKELNKRNTERLREDLTNNELKLKALQELVQEKHNEIQPLEEKLEEINILVESFVAVQQEKATLETKLKGIQEQQENLKEHIVNEFEGSDDDLNSEILNFDAFQDNINEEIAKKEKMKTVIDLKVQEINKLIQNHQMSFGKLKEEEAQQLKRCGEMKDLIEKTTVKYKIVVEEGETSNEFIYKLKNIRSGQELLYKNYQKDMERTEELKQTAINNVRIQLASAEETFSVNNKQIADTKEKIRDTKTKLGKLERYKAQLEIIDKNVDEMKQLLAKQEADFDENLELQQLEELDDDINKKDSEQTKLDREYKVLHQNSITEQKIVAEKVAVAEKQAEISSLRQKHEEDFDLLFGQNFPEDKYESAVLQIQKQQEETVRSLSKDVANCDKKITNLEATTIHINDKLRQHREELDRNKTKVENTCKGNNFSELLERTFNRREKFQREKGAFRSAKTLFEQFISEFQQNSPCCPVCLTDFSSNKSAVPGVITTLKAKIEDLPHKIVETDSNLKREEELYNKLQQLKPVSEMIERLEKQTIPELEKELHNVKESLVDAKLELAALQNDLLEPKNIVEKCIKVISDAVLLDRLDQEIKRSEQVKETLSKDLVKVSSNRTLIDTETELSRVKSELANLRRLHKVKQTSYNETKRTIQRLCSQMQTGMQKKLEAEKVVQERPLLDKQISEYRTIVSEMEKNHKDLPDKISALKNELSRLLRERAEMVASNKTKLEKIRADIEECRRYIDETEKLRDVIEQYEQQGKKEELERILQELGKRKNSISKLDDSTKILNEAIMKNKEELASQEIRLRYLRDNKELREKRVESEALQRKYQELNRKTHNNSIIEERKKVRAEIDVKNTEINKKTGEMTGYQEIVRTRKAELNMKEHRESAMEHKLKYFELKTQILAVADLRKYTEVLEKSILKFHQERMVQINTAIRELWRDIYKGNDIDYVEIKTVDEVRGVTKRSYTYSVVQVKKGVELEMRGRCSAGQRVLACLVIRMALAETFSTNCGILALDEPTTNLDRDNIMSLSDVLSRIITMRQKQKNFQLLIITHDEEFLQALVRDQSISRYQKVERNAEGFSEIKTEII
ncbi:DNA repair protein RAD50 isoform X2 [Euwallacea fornicatus]|uniref:DNA repair protein RAD50 isoform X2 n=1 Tax=Euwallacea fornicatus TaxID=995702 RepID=UPI00339045C4